MQGASKAATANMTGDAAGGAAGPGAGAAREVIQPARLVLGDAVVREPWWGASWVVPTGVGGMGVVSAVLVVAVVRWWKWRRMGACERGFAAISRRVGLSSKERAMVREMAGCVGPREEREEAGKGYRRGSADVSSGEIDARVGRVEEARAKMGAGRRGMAIEDVVEFRGGGRRSATAAIAMVRAAGREAAERQVMVESKVEVEAGIGGRARERKGVKPVAVLLSEDAFLRGAMGWLGLKERAAGDRERVVRVQQKVFAGKR